MMSRQNLARVRMEALMKMKPYALSILPFLQVILQNLQYSKNLKPHIRYLALSHRLKPYFQHQ
jgi:hypothetical protein